MASKRTPEPNWHLKPIPERKRLAHPRAQTFDRERVAATYMEALRLGLHPAPTLAEVFDVSTTHAYRMIQVVRRDGRIGRDEHQPRRATIKRGTQEPITWIACQGCLHPWPCPTVAPLVEGTPDPVETPCPGMTNGACTNCSPPTGS